MEIKYMKMLHDNPSQYPGKTPEFSNKGISFPGGPIKGIEKLEQDYGAPFPVALKEFLYLAGDFCYVRYDERGSIIEENQYLRKF